MRVSIIQMNGLPEPIRRAEGSAVAPTRRTACALLAIRLLVDRKFRTTEKHVARVRSDACDELQASVVKCTLHDAAYCGKYAPFGR